MKEKLCYVGYDVEQEHIFPDERSLKKRGLGFGCLMPLSTIF
jgi:hypothetical protein